MKRTIIATAFLLATSATAFADDSADHIMRGTRYYNIQEWTSALREYKDAYALDPRPDTLWAIAQTQRLSGDCRGAILTYKAYVRGASNTGANAAMEWIRSCEADLDAQRRAADATVAPATQARPAATAAPAAPPARSPARARSWRFDPLGDVLLIAGVGGLATGATLVAMATVDLHRAPSSPTAGDYARAIHSGRRDRLIGAVSGGAGALCLGAAIWRFASVASSNRNRERETAAQALGVTLTRGGAVASYAASF